MTSVVVTQTTINASVVQESVSVSVTSSPINVTISPVDINSHSAVTIGTANGLSLSGQVLSLGLSSALATGALSSADWSTFNGKLSDAPSDGTTYGRLNGAWSAVVSSVAWGGITGTLSNQTDLQAALNAKQNSLTFPLASTLGGTGVSNAGTITNASNTTITGGGTVALGGFTLTVPATGTVDLLGTAQTISATKTFTAAQVIDLSADALGLTIQGAATQTNPLLTLELSTGTDVLSVDGTGRITQVATSTDHTDDVHNLFQTTVTISSQFSNGETAIYDFVGSVNNSAEVFTRTMIGGRFLSQQVTGATQNYGGVIAGGQFKAQTGSSTSVSLNTGIGGDFYVTSLSNRASWVSTKAIGGRFGIDLQSNTTHTTTAAYSLYATTHVKNANITITTGYGLYVEDMTVAATNYAIYTNAGLVRFGDIVNTTESYRVDGTQVVSNRVIDARIDDAISSGDATTDGVIDAIRDALITHGLIAAA